MKSDKLNIRLSEWVEDLQARGKNSFSLSSVQNDLPKYSETAIKRSLNRLSRKEKIISIYKGYYLIISPQYALRGVLPPSLFLDGLMKHLSRPYYIGLLNAAAFHGSAHQQPQEFYVFTRFPVLRPTLKKGLKVNYISKTTISEKLLENRKTEIGYLKISSPALTAADLIQFEKRIGGITRASAIINDLAEVIREEEFNEIFLKEIPATTIQRLGYILDHIVNKQDLAQELYKACRERELEFYRIPLKTSSEVKGFSTNKKWKVIINVEIEIED